MTTPRAPGSSGGTARGGGSGRGASGGVPPRRVARPSKGRPGAWVPDLPARKMGRGEWLRLTVVMVLLAVLGLVIVFAVGNGSGTPTQRTPEPDVVTASP